MKNSKLLKSLFFIGWGGFFLFNSLDYKIGTILNPGAGWFPFYLSIILLFIGVISLKSNIKND
jgi:hypothetical protein